MHYNAISITYGTTRMYYYQCFISYQQQEKNVFTHRACDTGENMEMQYYYLYASKNILSCFTYC